MRYTIVLMLTSLVAADQLVTRACRELGNSCSSDADCCVNGFRNVGCRSKVCVWTGQTCRQGGAPCVLGAENSMSTYNAWGACCKPYTCTHTNDGNHCTYKPPVQQIPAPQNPRVPPVGLSRGRFRWFRKVSRDLASLPEADIAPRSDDEEDEGAGYGDYTGAL